MQSPVLLKGHSDLQRVQKYKIIAYFTIITPIIKSSSKPLSVVVGRRVRVA